MRPIPTKLRSLLERMPRMRMCEIRDLGLGGCGGNKIEWHHVWIYSGRQINEHWAIMGACEGHHTLVKTNKEVREAFERRSLEIASDEELAAYPKKPWAQIKKFLNVKKYE